MTRQKPTPLYIYSSVPNSALGVAFSVAEGSGRRRAAERNARVCVCVYARTRERTRAIRYNVLLQRGSVTGRISAWFNSRYCGYIWPTETVNIMFRTDCLALSLKMTKHVDRFQLSKAMKFESGEITQNSLINRIMNWEWTRWNSIYLASGKICIIYKRPFAWKMYIPNKVVILSFL